jgi:tetratricopeptide (TPR) repeat protein
VQSDTKIKLRKSWHIWLAVAALALAVVCTYWPTLHCDFVGFDDPDVVTTNPHVQQGITPANLTWILHDYGSVHYWAPVTLFTHMLDCQLFGMVASHHHLTNMLFHLANTLILFLLLRNITGAFWRSIFVAALFALHPLRVESVAWIAERKDLVSGFFFLLTIWAYCRYAKCPKTTAETRPPRQRLYLLTCFLFALALMSKPMVVTLPVVLLLLDIWPLGRVNLASASQAWPLLREKIPLFAMVVPISIMTFIAQKKLGAVAPLPDVSITDRPVNALVAYSGYLQKTFWPTNLAALYLRPPHYPDWQIAVALVLLAGVTFAVVRLAKTKPWLLAGWFWFLVTLLPVIGLLQAGDQSIADRFTYIPSIGLLIAVVWIFAYLARNAPRLQTVGVIVGVAALVVCGRLSHSQIYYWSNSETLFTRILAITPQSAVAHNNLASFYHDHQNIPLAIQHYEAALRINPRYGHAHYNLGVIYSQVGNQPKAIEHFEAAIAAEPELIDAYNDLAGALLQERRAPDALNQLNAALKLRPDSEPVRHNIANVLAMTGDITGAISNYIIATNLDSRRFENFNELGICYNLQNKFAEAIPVFKQGLTINDTNALAHCNLATAYVAVGQWIEASNHYERAVQLAPDAAQIQLLYGESLFQRGYTNKAATHLRTAARLDPNSAEARQALSQLPPATH